MKCDLGGPFDPGAQGGRNDQPTCFHKIGGFHGLNQTIKLLIQVDLSRL